MFKEILESGKPILVYSDFCNYSNKFLQLLKVHQNLFETCIKLNIDVDSRTKKKAS